MGNEISEYTTALVNALQGAYGQAWNIRQRGESTPEATQPWEVVIGMSGFADIIRDGGGGVNLGVTMGATVIYTSVGPSHSSGFQAADITATLAAFLAQWIPPADARGQSGPLAMNIAGGIRPEPTQQGPVAVNTGNYVGGMYWDIELDVSTGIEIPDFRTGRPIDQPEPPRRRIFEDYGTNIEGADVTLEAT